MQFRYSKKTGFSLIEVIAVISIVTLIFGGLFAAFEFSLRLIGQSRAKMTALALSTDRLEYIRSLPYDGVGTVFGIPSGAIPQVRTVSLNGITFTEDVLIEFVDDPKDGFGGADSNGILSDYKTIKIEYSWTIGGTSDSFALVSAIVPRAIETDAGGGTLRVNVFDADIAPLSGINVRLLNTTTTTTIDVTRQTDPTGTAFFTGAPAAANYQIFVSAPGYSSEQTYVATTSLPNPITLPVAVLEGDVSTMNFQVDELSDLAFTFMSNKVIDDYLETFSDESGLDATSSVSVTGGNLELANTAGVYELFGEAWLKPITPTPILSWGMADFIVNGNGFTDARVQFYTSTNTADILSEAVLPGNASGFPGPFVDLRGISTTTYPTLVPRILLETANPNVTPEVASLQLSSLTSFTPVAGATIEVVSAKLIGTLADAITAVPKLRVSSTTDADGTIVLSQIEWGEYQFSDLGGRIIAEACPQKSFSVLPGSSMSVTILTAPYSPHNLRVIVENGSGEPIYGATVDLERGAMNTTRDTSWCGQVYFPSLIEDTNYVLEVTAPGYSPLTIDPLSVSGAAVQSVILLP